MADLTLCITANNVQFNPTRSTIHHYASRYGTCKIINFCPATVSPIQAFYAEVLFQVKEDAINAALRLDNLPMDGEPHVHSIAYMVNDMYRGDGPVPKKVVQKIVPAKKGGPKDRAKDVSQQGGPKKEKRETSDPPGSQGSKETYRTSPRVVFGEPKIYDSDDSSNSSWYERKFKPILEKAEAKSKRARPRSASPLPKGTPRGSVARNPSENSGK